MFIASLKENNVLMRVPPQLYPTFSTFQNYLNILQTPKYLNYIKNSLIVAGMTVVIDLALAIFAGYALSRYHFPGRKTIMTGLLSAQVFPVVVIIISLYEFFAKLKLMNTHMELKGICPIIATPFTKTGAVDYESLEREVSYMADHGCHGVTLFF